MQRAIEEIDTKVSALAVARPHPTQAAAPVPPQVQKKLSLDEIHRELEAMERNENGASSSHVVTVSSTDDVDQEIANEMIDHVAQAANGASDPAIIHAKDDAAATSDIRAYQSDVAAANAEASDAATYSLHSELLKGMYAEPASPLSGNRPIEQPSEEQAEREIRAYQHQVADTNRANKAALPQHQPGEPAETLAQELDSAAASAAGSKRLDTTPPRKPIEEDDVSFLEGTTYTAPPSPTPKFKTKVPIPHGMPRFGIDDSGDWTFKLVSHELRPEARWIECDIDLKKTEGSNWVGAWSFGFSARCVSVACVIRC